MVEKKDVRSIARLARIQLSEKETVQFVREFSEILAYFDTVKKAKLKGVEPMTHSVTFRNVVREDEGKKASVEVKNTLLSMTQATKEGYVKVKTILE